MSGDITGPPETGETARAAPGVKRRRVMARLAAAAALPGAARAAPVSLLQAPVAVGGEWGLSLPASALTVLQRMRAACLDGVPLLSDRQPARLQVDNHPDGPPHVWLHFDDEPTAWIVVDVGERDWSRLAYQFGHELGHVLANSWTRDAKPVPGSQWLEEALVEAFSLRGLEHLAAAWTRDPPFPGDAGFGAAIQGYKDNQLRVYAGYAAAQGVMTDPRGWFRGKRAVLEASLGMSEACQALIPLLLSELMADPARVGEIGALNLWPGRGGMPLGSYLNVWERRCTGLGAAGWMPRWLRGVLLE